MSVLLGSGYFRPASSTLAASFTGKADGTWYFHVRAVDTRGRRADGDAHGAHRHDGAGHHSERRRRLLAQQRGDGDPLGH